ncbi:hypothetical protein V2G26_008834 [Clonostachys chloroleuca]
MDAISRVFSVTPKILPLRALDPPEHNRSQCISTGPSSSYSVDRGASHLSSSAESLGQDQCSARCCSSHLRPCACG